MIDTSVDTTKLPKIGLAYNCDSRNNGSAVLSWDATKRDLGLGENVRRFTRPLKNDTEMLKRAELDLLIFLDDGRDDIPWDMEDIGVPTAYWAVDTHLGFPDRFTKAQNFDYVFCAQKDGAERMALNGIKKSYWLPLACHPSAMPNQAELMAHPNRATYENSGGLTKMYDVAFVGFINEGAGPGSHNRLEYLDRLFREIPNFWVTTSCFFEEMALRYVRARVGMNVSIKQDINMRALEVPCTGTCMLMNSDLIGLEDFDLIPGEDFIPFTDMDSMVSQCRWGITHPEEREEMAKRAMNKVRARHTYANRMSLLIQTCGVALPEAAAMRADAGLRGTTGCGFFSDNSQLANGHHALESVQPELFTS